MKLKDQLPIVTLNKFVQDFDFFDIGLGVIQYLKNSFPQSILFLNQY